MIYGIGTDIVKIERINELYDKYQNKFIEKILSKDELNIFNSFPLKRRRVAYLAKRFAAKEAFVKALGTGFREDINFTSISVYNNKLGRPNLDLTDSVKSYLPKDAKYYISLSDEEDLVMAMVIIEA
jgi:holo-[acyl-carrier protein] synthase